jgi:hypothetical protein
MTMVPTSPTIFCCPARLRFRRTHRPYLPLTPRRQAFPALYVPSVNFALPLQDTFTVASRAPGEPDPCASLTLDLPVLHPQRPQPFRHSTHHSCCAFSVTPDLNTMVMPTVVNIVPDVLALFYHPSRLRRLPRFFRAPFATRVAVSLLISTAVGHAHKLLNSFCLFTIRAHFVTSDQNSRDTLIVAKLVLVGRFPSDRQLRLPCLSTTRVPPVSSDHVHRDSNSVAPFVLTVFQILGYCTHQPLLTLMLFRR